MPVPAGFLMHCMTLRVIGWLMWSIQYKTIQILIRGSNSSCLGDIQQFKSSLLPVWSNLSLKSVYVVNTLMSYTNLLCTFTNAIPPLPCLFRISKAVQSTFELVNSVTSHSVTSCKIPIFVVCASSVCSLKGSHGLMDGEVHDYNQYIRYQGCRFLPICTADWIAPMEDG